MSDTDTAHSPPTPPAPPPYDFEKRVGQFVALRDKIKAQEELNKAQLEPMKQLLEDINTEICSQLQSQNMESVRTAAGTASVLKKEAASVADKAAFWSYCVAANEFDLIDYKANPTAVRDYITKHGKAPPGVNWSVTHVTGVRRPTK